jgi:hypothetical protein
MSNEIIQIVACDDYEGFQQLNIFKKKKKTHLNIYRII